MENWLKNNWWSLLIALVTVVSTWAVYGYKLNLFEKILESNTTRIHTLEMSDSDFKVTLAEIKKDIDYIKVGIDKLTQ